MRQSPKSFLPVQFLAIALLSCQLWLLPIHAQTRFRGSAPDLEKYVSQLAARSGAIFSARFDYSYTFGKSNGSPPLVTEVMSASFSGESWIVRHKRKEGDVGKVSHNGKYVEFVLQPQPSASPNFTARLEGSQPFPGFNEAGRPPRFAGTLWLQSTVDYIKKNAEKGELVSPAIAGNTDEIEIEWKVGPADVGTVLQAGGDAIAQGGILRLHALPGAGFALARIEHLASSGQPLMTFECSDFEEVADGIYFPHSCIIQRYENGTPSYDERYKITKVEKVNQLLPDSDFTFMLPFGTSLVDARDPANPRHFLLSKSVSSSSEEGLERVHVFPAKSPNRTRYFYLLGGCISIFALIICIRLRRRKPL